MNLKRKRNIEIYDIPEKIWIKIIDKYLKNEPIWHLSMISKFFKRLYDKYFKSKQELKIISTYLNKANDEQFSWFLRIINIDNVINYINKKNNNIVMIKNISIERYNMFRMDDNLINIKLDIIVTKILPKLLQNNNIPILEHIITLRGINENFWDDINADINVSTIKWLLNYTNKNWSLFGFKQISFKKLVNCNIECIIEIWKCFDCNMLNCFLSQEYPKNIEKEYGYTGEKKNDSRYKNREEFIKLFINESKNEKVNNLLSIYHNENHNNKNLYF